MNKRGKFKKAFTLLELVIVIAIISILIIIAVPKYGETRHRARITAHNANVKALKNAAILYVNDAGSQNAGTISKNNLEPYLDNIEKIKSYDPVSKKEGEFEIKVNSDGDIEINPGIIETGNKNES